MVYETSKSGLTSSLTGIAVEFRAEDKDDLAYSSVLEKVNKAK